MLKLIKQLAHFSLATFYKIKGLNRFFYKSTCLAYAREDSTISIVFVQTFSAGWNSVKPIVNELISDSRFKVQVVVVPVGLDLNALAESVSLHSFLEAQIDKSLLLNAYSAETGDWIHPCELLADYFFYNRPYDGELPLNAFKSSSISKHSKICFLHYGYSLSNEYSKFWKNGSFIYNASIIFAENDTKYVEYYKALWLQRSLNLTTIYNIGYPRFELIKQRSHDPGGVKNILWTPRWTVGESNPNDSSFLIYIYHFIDFFKKNLDFSLIIRPHPKLFSAIIKNNIISSSEMLSIKQLIDNCDNIRLDSSSDYLISIDIADYFLTDYTALIADYAVTRKPIIYIGASDNFNTEARIMSESFYKVSNKEDIFTVLNRLKLGFDDNKEVRERVYQQLFCKSTKSSIEIKKILISKHKGN